MKEVFILEPVLKMKDLLVEKCLQSHLQLNIDSEKSDLFFDCISKGKISEDQLKNLLPDFNLTNVPDGSEEESQLIQLLIQKDYPLRIEEDPSTLRKQTIAHILNFSNSKPTSFNDREFVRDYRES